jgi:hypothetical protein
MAPDSSAASSIAIARALRQAETASGAASANRDRSRYAWNAPVMGNGHSVQRRQLGSVTAIGHCLNQVLQQLGGFDPWLAQVGPVGMWWSSTQVACLLHDDSHVRHSLRCEPGIAPGADPARR